MLPDSVILLGMLVTAVPDNMRLDVSGEKPALIESDLWNIAERIKEIDPNLVVVFHEGHSEPFTVMEQCRDGVTRFVARYKELDQRILEDLRFMQSIPFSERIQAVERKIDAANDALERPDEEVMDWLATEMRREMKKANMIDPIGEKMFMGWRPQRGKA